MDFDNKMSVDFNKKGIAVLIPAFQPIEERLGRLVDALKPIGFADIIIVDDGSGDAYSDVFEKMRKSGCTVIRHETNRGKGRALKTGLLAYRMRFKDGGGVVTADADGQHVAEDIAAVAEALSKNPDSIVLGSRTLGRDMPLRSRFGNKLTRLIFALVSGSKITDTQTGLRGIPGGLIEKVVALKGERYEFEMHMLLELKPLGITPVEVPIKTIYLEGNRSSHFKNIRDSFLIYAMIIKYIGVSLASFLIDYGLYALLNLALPFVLANPEATVYGLPLVVIIANLIARGVSSIFNFLFNRKILLPKYHRGQPVMQQMGKYYLLVFLAMALDTLLVSSLSLVISKYIAKILVGLFIFVCNFFAQKRLVYV